MDAALPYGSQRLQLEVVEGHQDHMVPHHQDCSFWYLADTLDGEADYIRKVPEED